MPISVDLLRASRAHNPPSGETNQVPTSGKRKALKMFGVIEVHPGDFIYRECEDKFTSASYQGFLQQIVTHYRCPVILIEDGASYHNGPDLRAFEQDMKNKGRLFVYRLPAYSPDKNPIEKLCSCPPQNGSPRAAAPSLQSSVSA